MNRDVQKLLQMAEQALQEAQEGRAAAEVALTFTQAEMAASRAQRGYSGCLHGAREAVWRGATPAEIQLMKSWAEQARECYDYANNILRNWWL